jgi:hypothetical protein
MATLGEGGKKEKKENLSWEGMGWRCVTCWKSPRKKNVSNMLRSQKMRKNKTYNDLVEKK